MSDFTSNFWSVYVTGITLVSIVACLLLLWFSGKTTTTGANDNTTGHVWDEDLRELNNPLPLWWVGLFIITCVFGFAYLYLYPGLGSYKGAANWTQVEQFNAEVERGNQQVAPIYVAFAGMSTEQLANNPQAMAIGDRLFMNNCAQCHGSLAQGGKGFPDLTDTHWTWGGTPEQIRETITHGRMGIMTSMAAAVGNADDIRNLANYVISLSNGPHDSVRAGLGKEKFAACAACHGPEGQGNPALGAPNLTRGIFIHGPAIESHVVDMINEGKTGVMPAWEHKFTPEQISVLTAYVWGKGGGAKPDAPAAAGAADAAAPAAGDAPKAAEEPKAEASQAEAAPADAASAAPAQAAAASADDGSSVQVENGVVNFYFASGKADLAAGADEALAEVLAGVKEGKKALVRGYVDSTGNAAQNAELSKKRAFAVRDHLKALGVPEDKIELQKPEDINAGTGAQARRVEVSLMQ